MYHAQHPGLRADDVRQALRLAATDGEGTDSRVAIVLVAGLVALLVAGLLAFGGTTSVPPIGSLVGGGGVLAVAIALIKRQRP